MLQCYIIIFKGDLIRNEDATVSSSHGQPCNFWTLASHGKHGLLMSNSKFWDVEEQWSF